MSAIVPIYLKKNSTVEFVPALDRKGSRCSVSCPFRVWRQITRFLSSSSFLWTVPRASHMTGKPSATELQ